MTIKFSCIFIMSIIGKNINQTIIFLNLFKSYFFFTFLFLFFFVKKYTHIDSKSKKINYVYEKMGYNYL